MLKKIYESESQVQKEAERVKLLTNSIQTEIRILKATQKEQQEEFESQTYCMSERIEAISSKTAHASIQVEQQEEFLSNLNSEVRSLKDQTQSQISSLLLSTDSFKQELKRVEKQSINGLQKEFKALKEDQQKLRESQELSMGQLENRFEDLNAYCSDCLSGLQRLSKESPVATIKSLDFQVQE